MNILVIGSGGREHALAWKIAQSGRVERVFVAPGNAGTAVDAENVDLPADHFPALVKFAKENEVALTVVGPEAPLAAGIVDAFDQSGLRIFGPRIAAAELEARRSSAGICSAAPTFPPPSTRLSVIRTTLSSFLRIVKTCRSWSRPTGWPPAKG